MRLLSSLIWSLGAVVCAAVSVSSASAGLTEWLAEVADGTASGYTNTDISSPIVDDIGTYDDTTGGGITYEFIVNATNDGISSALMGTAENPAAADRAGLKWEQCCDTGNYGATEFGVVDLDSGVANSPGVDTHVVFLNNGTDTELYVNGSLATTIADASLTLAGNVGIGQVYNPSGNNFDPLTGTIIGVAIYDAALSGDEIGAHYRSYIPEPGALMLMCLGLVGFAILRRRGR